MNEVTMLPLSPHIAQWNWISREDAVYPQVDGKTLCSFTISSYCCCWSWIQGSRGASFAGADTNEKPWLTIDDN